MRGTPKLLPPMPGTHDGMLNDRPPTVLFHADAMKLNAARNGH
jgi:hypothetical protein